MTGWLESSLLASLNFNEAKHSKGWVGGGDGSSPPTPAVISSQLQTPLGLAHPITRATHTPTHTL